MTRFVLLLAAGLLLAACQPPSAPLPASPSSEPAQPTTEPASKPDARPTPAIGPSPTSPEKAAANADVEHVRAVQSANGTWTFYVTIRHPDTGWEDYADGWDVVLPDGTVIKPDPNSPFTRLLLHPHVNEQPFTRSQSGILIPDGVTQVRVRAHDLVDGYGGREVLLDLTAEAGPGFEVQRQR